MPPLGGGWMFRSSDTWCTTSTICWLISEHYTEVWRGGVEVWRSEYEGVEVRRSEYGVWREGVEVRRSEYGA